jgi:SAM-dependent methyltransferase
MSVLDFSPSRCLYRKLKNYPGISYISTDLSGDFLADRQYDITAIDAPDNRFDLILCYHILEHIPADQVAMRELRRVLKPGGTCLVQTPFKSGEIYENPAVTTPEERLQHFGQEDHVRIYSIQGLKERLEGAGFAVEVKTFGSGPTVKNGFATGDTVLWLTPLKGAKNGTGSE